MNQHQSQKDKIEDFIKTWKGIIEEVRNSSDGINPNGAERLWLDFKVKKDFLLHGETVFSVDSFNRRMDNLESELETELELAKSRFTLKHRGIIAKIFVGILAFLLILGLLCLRFF